MKCAIIQNNAPHFRLFANKKTPSDNSRRDFVGAEGKKMTMAY